MSVLSVEDFIERSIKAHGEGKYDYSRVVYKTSRDKVEIGCLACGVYFMQVAGVHWSGCGCRSCSIKKQSSSRKLNTADFVSRAVAIHGCNYSYDRSVYTGRFKHVDIFCCNCGKYFRQTPGNHLSGGGCRSCSAKRVASLKKLSLCEFIEKSRSVHGDLFDYSHVQYVDSKTKVKILCRSCGFVFTQQPSNHMTGRGCVNCRNEKIRNLRLSSTEEFIEKSAVIHGERYDYSNVVYSSAKGVVDIVCRKCNRLFSQAPTKHLTGHGCHWCMFSKGEIAVEAVLNRFGVGFFHNHEFDDCRLKYNLKFDFYLPLHNAVIEYDGLQHFSVAERRWNDSVDKLLSRRLRDAIKNLYCEEKGIRLLRICYLDLKKVDQIVEQFLFSQPRAEAS